MMCNSKYMYRIELAGSSEVLEFSRIAAKCPYDVALVNGKHRLSAKSFLGVALAKISWDKMFVESDVDCYFDFEKFIK